MYGCTVGHWIDYFYGFDSGVMVRLIFRVAKWGNGQINFQGCTVGHSGRLMYCFAASKVRFVSSQSVLVLCTNLHSHRGFSRISKYANNRKCAFIAFYQKVFKTTVLLGKYLYIDKIYQTVIFLFTEKVLKSLQGILKTNLTTFIKAKLKKSNDQTNIDNIEQL